MGNYISTFSKHKVFEELSQIHHQIQLYQTWENPPTFPTLWAKKKKIYLDFARRGIKLKCSVLWPQFVIYKQIRSEPQIKANKSLLELRNLVVSSLSASSNICPESSELKHSTKIYTRRKLTLYSMWNWMMISLLKLNRTPV